MAKKYAKEFSEIGLVLEERPDLQDAILKLVDVEPMPGKATEGEDRLDRFKSILKRLFLGEVDLVEACRLTEHELPPGRSIHAGNTRVFPSGWTERLVRTQYSRFYNQVVMVELLSEGYTKCFVPHSTEEDPSTNCSMYLAGGVHDLKVLYERLIDAYSRGNWSKEVKIPDHPHCTHVITPIE